MTNHQDKELSSDITDEQARDLAQLTAYDADANGDGSDVFTFRLEHIKALANRIRATSPQLPVAEQPAGQAVADVREYTYAGVAKNGVRLEVVLRDNANVKDGDVLYIAPHSPVAQCIGCGASTVESCNAVGCFQLEQGNGEPVAQMSGDATIRPTYYVRHPDDSFSVADPQPILRRYCAAQPQPVHMQVDMRQMLVNIAHHWGRTITPDDESMFAEFITLAASHPSNAVQDARPALLDWPIPCDVTVGDGTIPKGCKLDTLLTRMTTFSSTKPAATVPQVVQAPAGWKLVPIEPTKEMMQAGFDVEGSHLYGLTYRAMVRVAPQPVAASPSIVPSDEQIDAAMPMDIQRSAECHQARWREFARKVLALTTASNAVNADSERLDWIEDWVALQFPDGATGNNIRELVDSGRKIIDAQIASNAGEAVKGGEA